MLEKLPNPRLRQLKAKAQLLDPLVKIGKQGLSDAFYRTLDEMLNRHELVKVKFVELKDQKKSLVPQIVAQTGTHLILMVGNVFVLHRPKPEAAAKPAEAAS